MNVVPGYRRISITICVLVEGASSQKAFGQARSEDDGGDAVQPGGTDTMTDKDGDGGLAGAVKLTVSGVACEA